MLNKEAFKVILSFYPELNIDLFATRLNNQLTLYCSWKPDPRCAFVDALTIDWNKVNFYAFPPFSLIPRCLQKVVQDQAKGILIIPVWPTQTWLSQVLQLLCNQPWILKPSKSLLQHASQQAHPLHNKLHLMVCPLSGNSLHNTMFLQTLPRSSWAPGEWAHRNNTKHTLKNGWHFVIKEALLTVHQR